MKGFDTEVTLTASELFAIRVALDMYMDNDAQLGLYMSGDPESKHNKAVDSAMDKLDAAWNEKEKPRHRWSCSTHHYDPCDCGGPYTWEEMNALPL